MTEDHGDRDAVEIDAAEWEDLRRLFRALDRDERDSLGKFALFISGGTRRWVVTDSYRLIMFDAGPDHGDVQWNVSPRLINSWPMAAGNTGSASLKIRQGNDGPTMSMDGPNFSVSMDREHFSFPDLGDILRWIKPDSPESALILDVEALRGAVDAAKVAPYGADPEERPQIWLTAADDLLSLDVNWTQHNDVHIDVPAHGTANGRVSADPRFLAELLAAFHRGDVEVTIPDDPADPVILKQGQLSAVLMPVHPAYETRRRVQEVLESTFGPDVLHVQPDGGYRLSMYGVPVVAHLAESTTPMLRLSAAVLADAPNTPELMSELNDLNVSGGMTKVIFEDGDLQVVGDLVANTVAPEDILTLEAQVRRVADGLGPALRARFGGRQLQSSQDQRWEEYAQTVIWLEESAGGWSQLTGTDATQTFPFEASTYLITAFNPHGRIRPADVNLRDNARLAGDLISANAGLARATGTSPDEEHSEPGFLVWGISEDVVLDVARKYEQEAIFEINDDTVSVIGAFEERIVTVPRYG